MKKIILIVLLLLPLQLFGSGEKKFDDIISSLRDGNRGIAEKRLQKINPNNNTEKFKKNYLLSLCCYSNLSVEMEKVIYYLQTAKKYLNDISPEKYKSLIDFVLSFNDIYKKILNFKEFVYEDFENVIDLLFEQFNLRIDICISLEENPLIANEILGELIEFKDEILNKKQRRQKEVIGLINKIHIKIFNNKPLIPDTRKDNL